MLRRLPLWLAVLVVSLAACSDEEEPVVERTEVPTETVAVTLGMATQTLCADGSDALCGVLPTDLSGHPPDFGYSPNTNATGDGAFNQAFVDYFAWQAFVALNWPLGNDGQPSSGSITSDLDAPRVWSAYPTKWDVFGLPSGEVTDASCPARDGALSLFRTTKFGLDEFVEGAAPVIDRYGNYVLYDVRINLRERDYLKAKGLTTAAGQQAFSGSYDFPGGSGAAVGAMEIKTSWRVMSEGDDQSSYFTTPATIAIPARNSSTGSTLCLDVTVGLVGMHIMQKFSSPESFAPYWSWATFEHVSNAPLADSAQVSPVNAASALDGLTPPACTLAPVTSEPTTYSFYNPACTLDDGSPCPINTPPPTPADNVFRWRDAPPYAYASMTQGDDGLYGTQVARCFEIYESAKTVTNAFQTALGGSPWSSYMLVGAQWAAATSDSPSLLTPFSAPVYLTNTTMETYIQTKPVVSSDFDKGSCIACHAQAKDTQGKASNMSFLPFDAQ